MWCNNWYSSLFKDYSFIIICCSAANCEILLLFCCFLFRSIFYFLFPLSFLSFSLFFSLFLFLNHNISGFRPSISRQSIKWVSMLNFRKSKISGTLHLVSEHMVKRQPWFCWVLLIRDRVSSTLEWVWV